VKIQLVGFGVNSEAGFITKYCMVVLWSPSYDEGLLKSGQSEVSFKDRNFGRLAPSLTVTVKNPILLSIPVCYVVTASNGLILGALIINHSGCKHHFSAWVGEPPLWLHYCFSSLVKTMHFSARL